MRETFRSLLSSRRSAQEKIDEERKSGEAWYTKSFENLQSYETRFSGVLQGQKVRDLLTERRNGRDVVALDFMGYGVPLSECDVKHGLATALTDVRPEELKAQQTGKIEFIPGDVLSKKMWESIDAWLHHQNSSSFDVILAAPNGGILAIPKNPDIYYWLANQFWQRLNSENGVALIEFPTSQYDAVQQWAKEVEKNNITLRISRPRTNEKASLASTLYLERSPQSPAHLPQLA